MDAEDISAHLPLRLIKSEIIPPCPNPSDPPGSAIDFLPDFAGYSWIAYGASSLLIISHFPSPLSSHLSAAGPILRQVIELDDDVTDDVRAVSWSMAEPSVGDLAAAAGNRVFVFDYDSARGSFSWSQTAVLLQSSKVEAVKWTGSGDGIIAGGMEVVLWKRNNKSWEIAWKFGMEHGQTLVSATWSIDGPAAFGAYLPKLTGKGTSASSSTAGNHVTVCQSGGKSGYVVSELRHPQPVLAIQWRHGSRKQLNENARHPYRHVLLTCSLDGAVRLWNEIEDGSSRKSDKHFNNPKTSTRTFHVSAVIEINQILDGVLGSTINICWALEMTSISSVCQGLMERFSATEYHDNYVGRCEWLISLGPGPIISFWAVHCLDDIAPMRPPQVMLWKKRKQQGSAVKGLSIASEGTSGLVKVLISRNQLFGPPALCSVVQLLPCSSLGWSLLYSRALAMEDKPLDKSNELSYLPEESNGILDIDGHTSKVLQVAVHPHKSEVNLSVSLDSNGLLLFWSFSASSTCISGLATLNPSWKFLGKLALEESTAFQSVRLNWAPTWFNEAQILLVAHIKGIDCFIIRSNDGNEERIWCHKLCTIPIINDDCLQAPDNLFSISLSSTSNHFLVIGVWRNEFQALSWKITVSSYDLNGSCDEHDSHHKGDRVCGKQIIESEFAGKRYHMIVYPCSSYFPESDSLDHVTSIAVVNPTILLPSLQQARDPENDSFLSSLAYHMVTGHSDGRVRLWRCVTSLSVSQLPWELVGMFTAHLDPVTAISVADYGQRIATQFSSEHTNNVDKVCIWEPANLAGTGCFVVEDTIALTERVLGLSWLPLGTGQFFLGVCLRNELRVYAQRRCSIQTWLNARTPSDSSNWFCVSIAYSSSAILDFFWGPMMTLVAIHEKCFSIFCPWSLLKNKNPTTNNHLRRGTSLHYRSEPDGGTASAVSDCGTYNLGKAPAADFSVDSTCCPILRLNQDELARSILVERSQSIDELYGRDGTLSIMEVAGKFCGSLPFYHPMVLTLNILSGNWKRALVALRHLVECFSSTSGVERSVLSAKSPCRIMSVGLLNYFEGLVATSGSNEEVLRSGNGNLLTSANPEAAPAHFTYNSALSTWGSSYASSGYVSESGYFVEALEKLHDLSAISDLEKSQAFAVVDFLDEISSSKAASSYDSFDELGKRFWSSLRLQQLDFHRRFGRMPSIEELDMSSRQIAWAFHSDCQETLFNSVLSSEPSWDEMRKIGVGFWYTNAAQLRGKMEKLARSQYLKNKDPKACALLYIALNRIQVLAGLFKLSRDEKDKPLVAFLSRNFQEEKHKAAALKNAYVLMGRHQLELAIAFFLLGGDTMSAISVCAKNLGDEQLALVICRLVEGNGGPLVQHLVSKVILPLATEKGDYWLASVLQWMLGNYLQSFRFMLGLCENSCLDGAVYPFKHAASGDPSVGQYCQTLAAKNSFRNAVGEQNSVSLSRWAIVITAAALNKCGLPLEALECLSSSSSIVGHVDLKGESGNSISFWGALSPALADYSNWMSTEVAFLLENHTKSDLAMQYTSELLLEHPSWICSEAFPEAISYFLEHELPSSKMLAENFQVRLNSTVTYAEQRFSLIPDLLLNKILVLSINRGLLLLGYQIVNGFAKGSRSPLLGQASDGVVPFNIPNYISVTAKDVAHRILRFLGACSLINPLTAPSSSIIKMCGRSYIIEFYLRDILLVLLRLKASFMAVYENNIKGVSAVPFLILDLGAYLVYLISSEIQRDLKALLLLVDPLLIPSSDGHDRQIHSAKLRETLIKVAKLVGHESLENRCRTLSSVESIQKKGGGSLIAKIPEEERWRTVAMCLWQRLSRFLVNQVNQIIEEVETSYRSPTPEHELCLSGSTVSEPVDKSSSENLYLVSVMLAESIRNTVSHISSYHARQLAAFLWQKVEDGCAMPYFRLLDKSSKSQARDLLEHLHRSNNNLTPVDGVASSLCPEVFWDLCSDPDVIRNGLVQVGVKVSELAHLKTLRGWRDLYADFIGERGTRGSCNQDSVSDKIAANGGSRPPTSQSHDGLGLVDSDKKESSSLNRSVAFQNPVEVYKRNGELFEALCINSVDQRQAAVASNRKGIIFINWNDGRPVRKLSDYIWSEADWPQIGWAGFESASGPSTVPTGDGRRDTNVSNLEQGGAAVGVGSIVRPGRDLTGGGTFGVPGYAGIGASGLGWQMQEDLEILETVSAKALGTHPSRPLFLVGSSNTSIYLWEFGEEKAAAAYGVPPAADVTALNFDWYGHRFANAASDGTVRTWQLEVGGRSNVGPTESSLCFNGSALDVCYVATSGSIIAAAGYSSNGANVVIWDTLAPPATSRASVMCHEGGACSIAVFDKDVGSGSITPLIVTGGKGGDVGLHDFRYIATGKTKRHGLLNVDERISDASAADIRPGWSQNMGDHNRNGMLWYIPKAHSGTVTKISTIPHTNLFLTGSKDGDVKLWDAKTANLVYHWPKLHEKHTFLQWGSLGFGGFARVAVTDIQVVSNGFLSCGGDGTVKQILLQDQASGMWN